MLICAACAQHWYPFRFFPGPFEPECGAGQNGATKTVVRWESEQALHVRVHPLVHTGVSLHTSLVWKRGAEEQSPPFRYAAWLRHLPELYLAPSTVGWAKSMLSSRLQGHHDFLVQQTRHQGGLTGFPNAPNSSGEARNGTPQAPKGVTASFSLRSSSCECLPPFSSVTPSAEGPVCSTPTSSDLLNPPFAPIAPPSGQMRAGMYPPQRRL